MNIYFLARFAGVLATKILFRPKIIGLDNVPKEGNYIFACNHTSMFDPLPLINKTKRKIHFLAKSELFKLTKSILFANMGLIPVYRNTKGSEAYKEAIKYLKNGEIIGIFPEGTRERGRGLLEFKKGCVRMAKETNTIIVPVAIKGDYKIFNNNLCFKIGTPIQIKGSIEKENIKLRNTIKDLLDTM